MVAGSGDGDGDGDRGGGGRDGMGDPIERRPLSNTPIYLSIHPSIHPSSSSSSPFKRYSSPRE
jgi:hypothetical protein